MTQQATSLFDPVAVQHALAVLVEPGQVVELRALNALTQQSPRYRHTASGYFTDMEALINAGLTITRATGIYITLNPCRRGLITRANNRLRSADDMKVDQRTTADKEILHYRWLPVDFDPVRLDCNDSSSDAEHETALTLARYVYEMLRADGWPPAILADSGNGAHILYRQDFQNTAADTACVQRALEGLSKRFGNDAVKIDTSVFNPSRIWKLYGSKACKGDSTPEWPHRMSRILEVQS